MKKINFLIKLKKKGVLESVEPSKDIAGSYLEKAWSNLESSRILFGAEKFEESVSLSYYSMYSSILALFFSCGIKCENHSAGIIILREIFQEVELFEDISFAKKERIDKQYYFDFHLTKEQAIEMIKRAEEFINRVEVVIKNLSSEKVIEIMKKFQEVIDETKNN